MAEFVQTGRGTVTDDWIDDNDHMNMMWYTHLIDVATMSLMRLAGYYDLSGDLSFVAGRIATAHRKELRFGDNWETWSRFESMEGKILVCGHKITSGRSIAARSEITLVPFDKNSRRPAEFPEHIWNTWKSKALARFE
jgi:acyl-CoA thioesterase FadM